MNRNDKNKINEYNIMVVGVSGTGKTCYMYSLIKQLYDNPLVSGIRYHSDDISDAAMQRIPVSTSAGEIPPPLTLELTGNEFFDSKPKINIYEIPGEYCYDGDMLTLGGFESVLKKADGIIYVVDPKAFQMVDAIDWFLDPLDVISNFFVKNKTYGIDIPIAVCISKIDSMLFQEINDSLSSNLKILLQDFNCDFPLEPGAWTERIASVSNILYEFIHQRAQHVDLRIKYTFDKYNYFAFSSLGLSFETKDYEFHNVTPIGVADPFWWMLMQLNICKYPIPKELRVPIKVCCPVCHYPLVKRLEGTDQYIYSQRKSLFSSGYKAIESHTCPKCDSYWNEKKRVKNNILYKAVIKEKIEPSDEKKGCLKDASGRSEIIPEAYKGSRQFAFVSYSHADMEQTLSVLGKLSENDYRFWYDEAIEVGNHWDKEIAKRIEQSECFIVMLSRNYLSSDNCGDELYFARELKKKILIVYIEDFEPENTFKFRYGKIQSIPFKNNVDLTISKLEKIDEMKRCTNK